MRGHCPRPCSSPPRSPRPALSRVWSRTESSHASSLRGLRGPPSAPRPAAPLGSWDECIVDLAPPRCPAFNTVGDGDVEEVVEDDERGDVGASWSEVEDDSGDKGLRESDLRAVRSLSRRRDDRARPRGRASKSSLDDPALSPLSDRRRPEEAAPRPSLFPLPGLLPRPVSPRST
jgi:hypothetical protein